jgi:hypothetical protein
MSLGSNVQLGDSELFLTKTNYSTGTHLRSTQLPPVTSFRIPSDEYDTAYYGQYIAQFNNVASTVRATPSKPRLTCSPYLPPQTSAIVLLTRIGKGIATGNCAA